MADLGTAGQEINAKKFQIFIGTNDTSAPYTVATNEWKLLQNASVNMGQAVFREPTTSGGNLLFTGAFDGTISGSLIFTRDEYSDGTNGMLALITADGNTGEVPQRNWTVKFTDVSGDSTNTTLTLPGCKLSVISINKSVEGGTKVDITVVCPTLPESS